MGADGLFVRGSVPGGHRCADGQLRRSGLNTVLAQVRPFGDALYESSLFPWSHLCTGTQGQAPGFDPLDVLITEAHARGLSLEAWINRTG